MTSPSPRATLSRGGILALLALLSAPALAQQEAPAGGAAQPASSGVYHWYDANGSLHVTDQIEEVPAAQRAEVLKRAQGGEPLPGGNYSIVEPQRSPTVEAPPAEASSDPPLKPEEDPGTKAYWQKQLADQRQAKADAEAEITRLESEMRHVKAVRPPGFHETLPRLEQEIADQQAIAAEAERQLQTVIPERARKADIPPGWLR